MPLIVNLLRINQRTVSKDVGSLEMKLAGRATFSVLQTLAQSTSDVFSNLYVAV
jgi:hypothetical protein